jgi:hypothetical protein
MSELLRRWLVAIVGAVVALLVATGAVLPAQPFDAWTTVIPGSDAEGSAAGEHGLDPATNERTRRRLQVGLIARHRSTLVPRRPRMTLRPGWLRWREARLRRAPTAFPDRSPPGPDRAPPSS